MFHRGRRAVDAQIARSVIIQVRTAHGTLQVHGPEGNVLLRRGITDAMGGRP
jgi:hypothetical protein